MKSKFLDLFYSAERNQTADLLKGFAVLFMIQVHITENFLLTRIYGEPFGKISLFLGGTPAAPVFMIVMGYFLSYKRDLMYFIERGTVLFLGGILLNIGLNFYFLVLYFQNQIIGEDPLQYIFGVDILPFAGLSLIIIGLLKEVFRDRYFFYLIVGLMVAVISDYLPALPESSGEWLLYILSFVYGCTEWSYFPLFPWLFYPLIGFSFRLISEKMTIKSQSAIIVISLIVLAVFAQFSFEQVIVLDKYYRHGILLALWNLAFVIIWFFTLNKLESHFSKNLILVFLKWIGKNVTTIYVLQWLIIGNLAMIYYDSQNEFQFFIWLLFVLISSSLLTFYYDRIKMKKLSFQTNE